MTVLRMACLVILSAAAGTGRDSWRLVPEHPPGPNQPDLVGATVDAIAARGEKESRARVVVSGARNSGVVDISVWIHRLSEVISEKELEPYIGPVLGEQDRNPRMMEITLTLPAGEAHFNTGMTMEEYGNLPQGIAGGPNDSSVDDLVFSSNWCPGSQGCQILDRHLRAFLQKMDSGFERGVVRIGSGVFSPPIVVRFGGEGVKGKLKSVMGSVGAPKGR